MSYLSRLRKLFLLLLPFTFSDTERFRHDEVCELEAA